VFAYVPHFQYCLFFNAVAAKLEAVFFVLQNEESKDEPTVSMSELALSGLRVQRIHGDNIYHPFHYEYYRTKRARRRWINKFFRPCASFGGPKVPLRWHERFIRKKIEGPITRMNRRLDVPPEFSDFKYCTLFIRPTKKWKKQVNDVCKDLIGLPIEEVAYLYFILHPAFDIRLDTCSLEDFILAMSLPMEDDDYADYLLNRGRKENVVKRRLSVRLMAL